MAITPYLLYRDVGAALEFLGKAFGFKKTADIYRDAEGTITHASLQLGKDYAMLGCPGKDYRNPKSLSAVTVMLYVDVADADQHCAHAKAVGANVVEEPADTFYGARRYGVEDPEGHRWYFAAEIKQTGEATQPAKKKPAKKKKAKRKTDKKARRRK